MISTASVSRMSASRSSRESESIQFHTPTRRVQKLCHLEVGQSVTLAVIAERGWCQPDYTSKQGRVSKVPKHRTLIALRSKSLHVEFYAAWR